MSILWGGGQKWLVPKASHWLSQWLLTQGWRSPAACDMAPYTCRPLGRTDGSIALPHVVGRPIHCERCRLLTLDRSFTYQPLWFGIFCRISPDILDRFLQSFHHMKMLYVQMNDLYLIFQGTLPWQPNNFETNKKVMKEDWYHLYSLH